MMIELEDEDRREYKLKPSREAALFCNLSDAIYEVLLRPTRQGSPTPLTSSGQALGPDPTSAAG
jgi:hypothetical protein